ncbi:hypothetical protein, partial [Streptantibioticus ferralitis]|nr:hypothetical protein [Streptantibioticus ferralitis]
PPTLLAGFAARPNAGLRPAFAQPLRGPSPSPRTGLRPAPFAAGAVRTFQPAAAAGRPTAESGGPS